ncbi:MAG: crossover junction endodeoxyribonuclease RuvC [bacterium]|nr:crossover junction endodeoxyribonuclease RuvC [bacterium]
MISLGIDPGTTRIGYGIIQSDRNKISCIAYGILATSSKDKLINFKEAEKQLSVIINKYKPDVAGVEKLFFFKNQKTIMAVSEMRGVIMLTLAKHNLPIHEFTPLQVKQNISAYGRADKNQVQRMVQMLLGVKEPIKPDDAVDALAIAICSAHNILS